MELAHSDEQSYQLKLQAYQTVSPNFKYEPSSFVYVEIGTNSRVLATPSMVQPVIKLINPLKGGIGLEIIPLPVQTFIIHVPITTIVSQPMESSERLDKKQDELVNPTYTILDTRLESLEFLFGSVHLTPH
jgi:hypothetical protein